MVIEWLLVGWQTWKRSFWRCLYCTLKKFGFFLCIEKNVKKENKRLEKRITCHSLIENSTLLKSQTFNFNVWLFSWQWQHLFSAWIFTWWKFSTNKAKKTNLRKVDSCNNLSSMLRAFFHASSKDYS